MRLVHEAGLGALDAPGPLHIDRLGAVDHDLRDLVILEQAVDGAIAEDVVGDVLDELRLVGGAQRDPLLDEGGVELLVDAQLKVVLRQSLVVEDRAELLDQVLMDPLAQLVEHRVTLGAPRRSWALHLVETLVEAHPPFPSITLSAADDLHRQLRTCWRAARWPWPHRTWGHRGRQVCPC